MNKLFVRLAASGAIAATLSAPALASNVSIDTTGPDSTNTVTSNNSNSWRESNQNWVGLDNWNNQCASSGNSWISHNTRVDGGGGSGNAYNANNTQNLVDVSNNGGNWGGGSWSGGNNNARIFLTGPDSTNRITFDNRNNFRLNNTNNVGITNLNDQNARSGDVDIHGNTVVRGGGSGSGDAYNTNSTVNAVSATNSSPSFSGNFGSGGSGSASIGVTGPDSYNSIRSNNNSNTNISNRNTVGIANVNQQTAQSGDVSISHNTVVDGVGGSGNAVNSNRTINDVSLEN